MTGEKPACEVAVCLHAYKLRADGTHPRKLTDGSVGDAAGATWR